MARKKAVVKKSDVDWGISWFTGPLGRKDNHDPVLCQMCGKEEATWRHNLKRGGACLLCFGCGGH